jgi:hypothetical protein
VGGDDTSDPEIELCEDAGAGAGGGDSDAVVLDD